MVNKVKFGLEGVRYAKEIIDPLTGKVTYGEIKRWPGAVELALEPNGDAMEFEADNIIYYFNQNNQGYKGTFTSALVPDEFRVAHLGEVLDDSGVQMETSDAQSTAFALMFELKGDKNKTRHCLYSCNASRPKFTSKTSKSGEPETEELEFLASPRVGDGLIKTKVDQDKAEIYKAWNTKVWEPTPKV